MAVGRLCVPTHGTTGMPQWFVDSLDTHHLVSLILMPDCYIWSLSKSSMLAMHEADWIGLRNDHGDALICCWYCILLQELLVRRICTQFCIQIIVLLKLSYSVLEWNPTLLTVLKISMKRFHVYLLVLLLWAVIVSLAQSHHIGGAWRDVFPPIFIYSWRSSQCILHWWCSTTQKWVSLVGRQVGDLCQQCLGDCVWWWLGQCRCFGSLQTIGVLPIWYVSLYYKLMHQQKT